MATTTYTGPNERHQATLVANTVDTVTFMQPHSTTGLRVYNSGAIAVYFTVDGTTPTANGSVGILAPANDYRSVTLYPNGNPLTVKLISSGAMPYVVFAGCC